MDAVLAGVGTGLSLIVAIGAQNLFVLRQGIRREHVLLVALLCAVSDAVLIVVGVSGIGVIVTAAPWLLVVIRWAGAAFLVGYGLLAARRAWRPSGRTLAVTAPTRTADAETTGVPQGRQGVQTAVRRGVLPVALTCLALTWLNPHVYLDTVLLLGSVANTYGDGRWLFAAGAAAASLVWFFGLAFGARLLSGILATPRAWRILDGVIAVVMVALGISLLVTG